MEGFSTHPLHEFREEARRSGYGSDSAITTASNSPQRVPFRFKFDPEARPFIPGALSHPPTPAEENPAKSGTFNFTGIHLNPTAPAFVLSPYAFYPSPGMGLQSLQEYSDPQDPFFDFFADANVFPGVHQGSVNYFDQQQIFGQTFYEDYHQNLDQNAGYEPTSGFANTYSPKYMYSPNQYFAVPATRPVFALDSQHAIGHAPTGSGE